MYIYITHVYMYIYICLYLGIVLSQCPKMTDDFLDNAACSPGRLGFCHVNWGPFSKELLSNHGPKSETLGNSPSITKVTINGYHKPSNMVIFHMTSGRGIG